MELGRRAGKAQSAIGRWERGEVRPSLETLRQLIRACGYELTFRLANYDDSYVADIEDLLDLTADQRVESSLERSELYLELMSRAGVHPAF